MFTSSVHRSQISKDLRTYAGIAFIEESKACMQLYTFSSRVCNQSLSESMNVGANDVLSHECQLHRACNLKPTIENSPAKVVSL